jgi:hypothetical protein
VTTLLDLILLACCQPCTITANTNNQERPLFQLLVHPRHRLVTYVQPHKKMSTPNTAQGPAGTGGRTVTLSTSLAVALLTIYLAYTWYEWRKLSHVPGPTWASLTKLWMVRQSLRRRQPFAFKETHATYGTKIQVSEPLSRLTYPPGSLVRVGPNEVVTNDPEILRKIMAVRSTYTRGECR